MSFIYLEMVCVYIRMSCVDNCEWPPELKAKHNAACLSLSLGFLKGIMHQLLINIGEGVILIVIIVR